MRFESFSALRGCLKNSSWLSSDKTFVTYDISQFFQGTGMAGKIAVCQRELLFRKLKSASSFTIRIAMIPSRTLLSNALLIYWNASIIYDLFLS